MIIMHKSSGVLKVFNTWALLECDDGIGQMYRSLYSLEYFYRPKIQKPVWGTHISIIRGEKELDSNIKKEIHEQSIEFNFIPRMFTNGCHYYLPVICPVLDDIREMFGLGKSIVDYHLSIGNTRNN